MGRSVHNQRIERFWRDLFGGCTCLYYNLLYYIENTGVLDPCNTSDIFCLHYIFQGMLERRFTEDRVIQELYEESEEEHATTTHDVISPCNLTL